MDFSSKSLRGKSIQMKRLSAVFAVVLFFCAALQCHQALADDAHYFSGKTTPYVDSYNGWKMAIPDELPLTDKGVTTIFTGPNLNGAAVTIWVNTTEMPNVPSVTMYNVNLNTKKNDGNFSDVVALPVVKYANKPVYAFRCSEAGHKPGTNDPKDPTEIHRWYLYVFGNNRQFQATLTANYQSFTQKQVNDAFNAAIKSFALAEIHR